MNIDWTFESSRIPVVLAAWLISVACYLAMHLWRRKRLIAWIPRSSRPSGDQPVFLLEAFLFIAGLTSLSAAALDIRIGKVARPVVQQSIEIVAVLDVSRSMLAEDAKPNRLNVSKSMIEDLASAAVGDAFGLVIFSGEARLVVPMTRDRSALAAGLREADPFDLYRGGSDLKNALSVAANAFIGSEEMSKVIVLFSDGEDLSEEIESDQIEPTELEGIKLVTIGVGDAEKGSRIPAAASPGLFEAAGIDQKSGPAGFIRFEGQPVVSRMDRESLQSISSEYDGIMIEAGTSWLDMASMYQTQLSQVRRSSRETRSVQSYEARYQWFLASAAICFAIAGRLSRH